MTKKLRVLIVDDQTVLRDALKLLIDSEADMETVALAGDAREALERARSTRPDVVVMDVSMPGPDGVEATERIRRELPRVKVLGLSVHESTTYFRQMLRAGAAGYVVKRSAARDLVRAIRAVGEGGVYTDPVILAKLVPPRSTAGARQAPHRPFDLSSREEEVLQLLAWGYTSKEIAGKLSLSAKTVETYKVRLMEKLDLRTRVDIVKFAVARGWLKPEGQ